MVVTCVARGWAFASDKRSQRRRRTSAELEKIALKFIDKKYERTHPSSQVKRNRACQASPTMWRARSSHRNGRRTATDVGRCRGRRSGFVFLDFFRWVVSTSKQPPQREFSQIARVRHRIWCSEHTRCLRMGDKQRRAAAEAAADIAGVRKKSLQLSLV
jgi:hypothetical protein